VPVWAERAEPTTWHPQHIAERYGLLTLIVLGESILSATVAIQSALASGEALPALLPLIIGGLLIVFSMWWAYFDRPVHDLLTSFGKAIVWGYGHYLVFAAAAAVGAGLAVSVDQVTHHAKVSAAGAGAAVAIPIAVFLVCLWILHDRPEYRQTRWLGPIAAGLVLLTPFSGYPVLLTGGILASLIAIKLVLRRQAVRRTHMYLALFLFPWVLMYALSTLVMNHRALFVDAYGEGPIPFVEERRLVYEGVFPENADLKTISTEILMSLGFDGAHGVSRRKDGTIAINRNDLITPRRLTYSPADRTLLIERMQGRPNAFLERFHRRRGYATGYALDTVWAGSVDLFIIAMVFWVASGLWMWWEMKVTRRLGLTALAGGVGVFALYLLTM
jgi:hypothetical protein